MRVLLVLFLAAFACLGQPRGDARRIWGYSICADTPADTQVLAWSAARSCWAPAGSTAGAPDNAGYVTTKAEGGLSAEASLGGLADNSPVCVDTAAGVATPRACLAGDIPDLSAVYLPLLGNAATATALVADPAGCTNQFTRDVSASGVATCASVAGTDFANQNANLVFAGPATAPAAAPAFRSLGAADMPASSNQTCLQLDADASGPKLCHDAASGWKVTTSADVQIFACTSAGVCTNGDGTAKWEVEGITQDSLPAASGTANTFRLSLARTPDLLSWITNGLTRKYVALGDSTGVATTASALAADPAGCTNQFVTDVAAAGTLTCSTATLAGVQFANQGTTTTVLHGNGAGNPSWSAVVVGDLASADFGDFTCNGAACTLDTAPLPLAGGTLTGQLITDNLGIEFEDSDTNPACAAGNYNIFADLSETKLKKCVNGSVTDLDTTGGTVSFADITAATNGNALVVGTGGSLGVSGSGTITATDLSCTDCIGGTEIAAASDTVEGTVELATATETTNGTDATRAVTPDGLSQSDFGKRIAIVEVIADATALAIGDGKAYLPLNAEFNGWVVVGVSAHLGAAVSSSGAVDVDIDICGAVATGIRCSGSNRDLLSTNLTIDANEDGTETAAAAAVINTANDDVVTGEWIRFNIDGAGTGAQGLYVTVVLQKP